MLPENVGRAMSDAGGQAHIFVPYTGARKDALYTNVHATANLVSVFYMRVELLTVVEDEQMSVTQVLAQFVQLLTGEQAPPPDTIYDFELEIWAHPLKRLVDKVSGAVQLRRDDGGLHIVLDSGCHTNTVAPGIYLSRLFQGSRRHVQAQDKPTMPVTYTAR